MPGRSRELSWLGDGPRTFWPALLVLVAVSVGAVLLWWILDAYMRTAERQEVGDRAQRVARLGESLMSQRLVALETLRELWQDLPAERADRWRAHAQYFLESHSDILLIAATEVTPAPADGAEDAVDVSLVDPPDVDRTTEVARGSEILEWFRGWNLRQAEDPRSEYLAARKQALASNIVQVTGPIPTSGGGSPVFEIVIPTTADAPRPGLLTVIQRPSELFQPLTASGGKPYAITVSANDVAISEQGVPAASEFEGRTELKVARTDEVWNVSIQPTQAILDEPRWQFARSVLTAGLVIAVLLAWVVQLGQLARTRARALGIANDELQARVGLIEHREAQIREINQSLEERVKERTDVLNETIRELETYNYSVSHDLRSPLGAILNFAAILQEDYSDRLDQAGREYLRRVSRCANVAVSMMDSLLAFSRVGREKMSYEQIEMSSLFKRAFSDLVAASGGGSVHLKIEPLPGCRGDTGMIRLVVLNLLSNAIKFTRHATQPTVEVGGYETVDECVYFVRDNGVGFDMHTANQLFGVFERLHTSEEYEGHGVGLAIVRRIVQRHGGRVWAEAAPGKGATFYFSVPRE